MVQENNNHIAKKVSGNSDALELVIQELTRIVSGADNCQPGNEDFTSKLRELVDFDWMTISGVIELENLARIAYYFGDDHGSVVIGQIFTLEGDQIRQVLATGVGLVSSDLDTDQEFPQQSGFPWGGCSSGIILPLVYSDRVVGLLSVGSRHAGAFQSGERAILERLATQIAPAVEIASLRRHIQHCAEETALADAVAYIITSTLHIDEVYEKFALEMQKLVDVDGMSINVVDREAGTFTHKYFFGPSRPGQFVGSVNSLEGTFSGFVVSTCCPQIQVDLATRKRFASDLQHFEMGMRSSIGLPLTSKDRVIGTLILRSRNVNAYGQREQAILERLASQIAPAVVNAEVFQELQAGIDEATVLDEVAHIITWTTDIYAAHDAFAAETKKLVDFDRLNINLIDRSTNTRVIIYVTGMADQGLRLGDTLTLENTLTEQLMLTGKTDILHDRESKIVYRHDQMFIDLQLRSRIGVPLISKGQVIGSLNLHSHHVGAFGSREQAILERLANQIAPAIENAALYEEHKQSEQSLRKLSRAVEQSPSAVVITDINGNIEYVNPKFMQMTGYTREEIIGKTPRLWRSGETSPEEYRRMWDTITSGGEWRGQFHNRKKNGELYWCTQSITGIRDSEGNITHFVAVEEDVTERKQLEEQLAQSQKMESIGRMAGGVAHDFNNLLTAIMGYSHLASLEAQSVGKLGSHIQEILKATERAANLTNQLLAFSRHQVVETRVIDLNDLILDLHPMLRRLIGEDIELVTLPAPHLDPIKVDSGQIEQVLVNLVLNARDAMPEGGKLTIETANHTVNPESRRRKSELAPGQYARLVVSDTGAGMPKEVQDHIFEPFFTTKEVGKGTGLGLATCYGIVKQSGGHIEVDSRPGYGASVSIYIPVTDEPFKPGTGEIECLAVPHGKETVLLAEDEPLVRSMVATVLRDQGYEVLETANGDEALQFAQKRGEDKIHLLVTDIVMPNMGGVELAERMKVSHPNIKTIFTSGYAQGFISDLDDLDSGAEFLSKPYRPEMMALKVREVLDRSSSVHDAVPAIFAATSGGVNGDGQ